MYVVFDVENFVFHFSDFFYSQVGVMMFGNSKRVDWADYKIAVPAYCVLFFIPFTYSILRGVIIGYLVYIAIGLFTG